jgi:hypothetical protein
MRVVSFYDKDTGILADYHLTASDEKGVELNTPPNHMAINGHHNPLTERVDVETGKIVDHTPPLDSIDINEKKRQDRIQARQPRLKAMTQISVLETKLARLNTQYLLSDQQDTSVYSQLALIESQIIELEKIL